MSGLRLQYQKQLKDGREIYAIQFNNAILEVCVKDNNIVDTHITKNKK